VKPTVISLFAGTGGSSLGYRWAGFRELLAVDFDSHAVECFKLNFPDVPIWQRSVVDITGKEILDFCGLKPGELDVLDGSPPCQGFSTAGKREVTDPRNDLFKHYVRLIEEVRPKVFVMENVSGMAKGTMKGRFIEIMKALKATGYSVKAKQMNAANYGVPQSRERIIFIGMENKKEPTYPAGSKKILTVRDAFLNIKNVGERVTPSGEVAKLIPMIKQGESASKYHPKGHYFGVARLSYNRPSRTIIKSANLLLHQFENKGISINEAKALCSFPEDWVLTGTYEQAWNRLGNAVMPKFMQAIAEHIKKELLNA